MEVQWTRRALRQIKRQARFIAFKNRRAAYEMEQRIRYSADGLADNPLMGREGRRIGTRELVVEKGRYVVVYRVRGQAVQVITVHDTRQQWPEDWKDA